MKNLIKKNRYTVILLLAVLLFVLIGIKVKDTLMPDENKAAYGTRLDDMPNHKLENDIYTKIEDKLKENDKYKSMIHRLQGKVFYFTITVNDDTSIVDAKKIADQVLTVYSEDSLSYYSWQFFIVKEDKKQNNFPISGMKNAGNDKIVWSNDREIVSEDKDEE